MNELTTAIQVCPRQLQTAIHKLPVQILGKIEEIRLRNGQTPTYVSDTERPLSEQRVKSSDLQEVIDRASSNSAYAVQEMLKHGFLTIPGGHRIGICGTGVYKDGRIFSLRDVSSINLRVARQIRGVADRAVNYLWTHPHSTLIIAPPGRGKTTLLRDLLRQLSDRFVWRIGLVDERLEVASQVGGTAQLCVGTYTDVLSGIAKCDAIEMLLRSMNPQWIALDEITAPKDIETIFRASYCGVKFIATAHAATAQELYQRPLYRELMQTKVFRNVIVIDPKRNLQMEGLADD